MIYRCIDILSTALLTTNKNVLPHAVLFYTFIMGKNGFTFICHFVSYFLFLVVQSASLSCVNVPLLHKVLCICIHCACVVPFRCKHGPRHRCCKHYQDNCISYCVKVRVWDHQTCCLSNHPSVCSEHMCLKWERDRMRMHKRVAFIWVKGSVDIAVAFAH